MLCKDNCLHFFYNLRMLVGHIVVFVNVRSQIVKERYTFLHYYFPVSHTHADLVCFIELPI